MMQASTKKFRIEASGTALLETKYICLPTEELGTVNKLVDLLSTITLILIVIGFLYKYGLDVPDIKNIRYCLFCDWLFLKLTLLEISVGALLFRKTKTWILCIYHVIYANAQ